MFERGSRGIVYALVAGFVLSSAFASAAEPTTRKAASFSDNWMGTVCLEELKNAVEKNALPDLKKRLEAAVLARLSCGQLNDMDALTDAVYVLRACEYLPEAGRTASGAKLANMLAGNREVARHLYRSIDSGMQASIVFKSFGELFDGEEKMVVEYPTLAVAFATSLPGRYPGKLKDPASTLDSFKWYAQPKVPFRFPMKTIPYEVARYLADSRLAIKERQWAVATYMKNTDGGMCGRAYADIRFDVDYWEGWAGKKLAKFDFTLENIKAQGGVYSDMTHYCVQVGKSLGIPAVTVYVGNGADVSYEYPAYLNPKNAQVEDVQGFSKIFGSVINPLTGKYQNYCNFILTCYAGMLPLERREQADAAVYLARLVDNVRDSNPVIDRAELARMAEMYNAKVPDGKAKADAEQMPIGKVKIDLALVEEMFRQAMERNLAYEPAWDLLLELRKKDRLPADRIDRYIDIIVQRTAKEFPDFSCDIVQKIIPTIPDPEVRLKAYERMRNVYGKDRTDLIGQVMIAVADDLQSQGKKDRAYAAYENAANICIKIDGIVIKALDKAEKMLLESNKKEQAMKMYESYWGRCWHPSKEYRWRRSTAWYILGKRYASLLLDLGKEAAAKDLYKKLES